jgi:integrase
LGRDPLTGRRITKYVTVRGTKRKAQEELTRLLSQRNDGTYIDPTRMTVAEYLRHWLEADIDRRVAARTAARHRGIVEKNIIPKLGHVPVRKLTAAQCDEHGERFALTNRVFLALGLLRVLSAFSWPALSPNPRAVRTRPGR